MKREWFGTQTERSKSNWPLIRRAKFRTHRYGVFAIRTSTPTTGFAENGGDDFVVTLGPLDAGTPNEQAGTLMHELGHNLGLRHGGDTPNNNKPNYHSVMNYTWQLRNPLFAASWQLDYSRSSFRVLNETSLNEPSGIDGHAGHFLVVGPPPGRVVAESGAVDWNRDNDGGLDTVVTADVNHISGAASPGDTLMPYVDWANIQYSLTGHPNLIEGVHSNSTLGDELSIDIIAAMRAGDADCNGNGTFDHTDIGDCTSLDCNGDGVPDDCDIASGWSQDGNSNTIPDECECATTTPPSEVSSLDVETGFLAWSVFQSFEAHDVVQGDLHLLRSSGGNYTLAVDACLASETRLASLVTQTPTVGEAWFYVHRGVNCAGNGSLDSGGPSQVGSRDVEVEASPNACTDCGNGILGAGELCDGWNLGCETCVSQGFGGGTLGCDSTCDAYDVSGCQ